jgi:hypothetical protein
MVRAARRRTEPGSLRGGEEGYNARAVHRAMHTMRTDVHTARIDIRTRFAEALEDPADRVARALLGLRSGRLGGLLVQSISILGAAEEVPSRARVRA